ncbi:MAG: efflux RND transporter permease subunit, partial [Rhodospirillales bacterium]
GILIVEFANQLRDEGKAVREALLDAITIRLRPILMTAVSTAAGAIPLILASGAGAESRAALGIVIFSGIITATILTLYIVPVFYARFAPYTKSPGYIAAVIRRLRRERPEATPAE